MNETGPDAVPPPAIFSREERMVEVETSARAELEQHRLGLGQTMIEDIVSSTELMKQALHYGSARCPR
jgi:hypothetical protein